MPVIPALDEECVLRNAMLGDTGYRLMTWDLNKRAPTGQWLLGYAFWEPNSDEPLFCGEDYGCSPMNAVDSDDALRALMGFLTLRRGDTDGAYFKNYSPYQLAWAEANGEEMSMWGIDLEQFGDPEGAARDLQFIDIEEEDNG